MLVVVVRLVLGRAWVVRLGVVVGFSFLQFV